MKPPSQREPWEYTLPSRHRGIHICWLREFLVFLHQRQSMVQTGSDIIDIRMFYTVLCVLGVRGMSLYGAFQHSLQMGEGRTGSCN